MATSWLRLVVSVLGACALGPVGAAHPGYAQSMPPGTQTGAVAQDPVSGRIFIALPASNAVFVMARDGTHVLTVLAVPPSPSGIAVDPAHKLTYVASDPAGMISAFDDVTYKLVHIYAVGGHPAGLVLTDDGRSLLFTDAASGTVNRLAVPAGVGQPEQVVAFGPGTPPQVAPQTVWIGQETTLWARGFAPGEPVNVYWVYWGVKPLARTMASPSGFVTVTIQVPPKVNDGDHMVILYGRHSTISQSTLVTVVSMPVVPKHRLRPRQSAQLPPLFRHLLAPSIVVPNPLAGLLHHAKQGQRSAAQPTVQLPIIALSAIPLVLLVVRIPRVRRRRRERKAERQAKKQKGRRRGRANASSRAKPAA